LRLLSFDESLVGMDCVLVGRDRVGVASHPDVDVGGHVDEMPGARHQRPSRSAHGTALSGATASTAWM